MSITQSTPAQLISSLKQTDDVVTWINDALNASDSENAPELTELEQQIATLLASLDIAQEDLSSEIEATIDEVSRNVPRLTYDLQFMKNSALSLQASVVRAVQSTKESVPDATGHVLVQLRQLDTVKRRMELTRDALREAESWSTLELEVTSLLSEHSYGKAAERLSEANRSVVVFQNTPEYESRRTLMVNLQNQLEASLSSALVAAINAKDINACRDYFSIFCQIQRESEFRNYYYASRRSAVVNAWNKADLIDCGGSKEENKQKFVDFLKAFFGDFLSLLLAEQTYIPSIFPDPAQSLSGFICSTLSSLQPSFSQRLALLSEHYGSNALDELIAVLKATENFAVSVRRIFQPFSDPSAAPPSTTPSRPQAHARRRSSRMSISLRPTALGSHASAPKKVFVEGVDWEEELFQPFLYFQVDYGTLELQLLEALTKHLGKATSQALDATAARSLKEGAGEITRISESSMPRCNAFTYGYGFLGLVHALDSLLAGYVDSWASGIGVESHGSTQGSIRGDLSLSNMDYSPQDWSDFQLFLHLLASARSVHERVIDFDSKLHTELVQTTMRLRFPVLPPPGDQYELLSRSPLNSAELVTLLDKAEAEIQSRESGLLSPRPTHLQTAQSSEPLLVGTRRSIFAFASNLQAALQHTILAPLRGHLANYASSPAWSTSGNAKSRTLDTELKIPVFSLSPTEAMQRIGEGILNLPQLFEVYADDDALGFSLHTLPHVDLELIKGPSEPPLEPPSSPLMQNRRLSMLPPKTTPLDPETVSTAWLSSLGHTLLHHLTGSILPSIPTLTPAGAAQLSSDLDYLSNILSAINVQSGILDQWRILVQLEDEEAKERIANDLDSDEVLRLVARMRGWTN